ncbi:MAG TPA: hypothetical protein PKL46_06925 [Aquabacterium sp.]|nr:hypothetical protein [Aquabacterium sp.]
MNPRLPTSLPTRRALLAALPGTMALFSPAASALAAEAALPPPNAEVRRTRQQLDTLDELLAMARRSQSDALRLARSLGALADLWRDAQAAARDDGAGSAPLAAVLATLRQATLPGLADLQTRWQAAVGEVDVRAQAHLAAVHGVLAAHATRRGAAMDRLDAAAGARRAAEAAERRARQSLREAMQQGSATLSALGERWGRLGSHLEGTTNALRHLASSWTDLHTQWQALQAAAQAAAQAADQRMALPALPQPGAPWTVPTAWTPPAPPDGRPLRDWRDSQAQAAQAQAALWLQADALAAAQQALADATCQRPKAGSRAACAAWQDDATGLQAALAAQHAALAQARDGQARHAAALHDQLAAAERQLQAMLDWQDGIAPAAATAGGSALQAVRAAHAIGEAAVAHLAQARQQAEAAWIAAWRAQYGSDPPLPPVLASIDPQILPPAPAMASMARMLSSHALHRLRLRDDEPAGFGAYTYVLVGASVRPDTPGVFNRLQRLLGEVRHLPTASELSTDQRARANTFVVPVPAGNTERDALVVDLPLAQSLLTHLPPSLRLADATRRRLYVENGPFLITLPGRLSEARADWPLLFADLSRTPEPVVADVVRRYMADLIGSFNPASTDWQPPAGMQVAITLVRLVKGSGDVAQAVFGGFGR